MREVASTHPGCLVATVTFQDQSFDREVSRLNTKGVLAWREHFQSWIDDIVRAYPPERPVDTAALADSILAITYGGMVLAKALNDPNAIARQTELFRETIRLIFR